MKLSSPRAWLALLTVVMLPACARDERPPVIARVGDLELTASEFRRRFELNPRLLQFADPTQARVHFLGVMVAEKLLAHAALMEGLSQSARTEAFLTQIKREATIEAFYDHEIAAQVEISEQELRTAYARQRRVLTIQVASFSTRQEAQQFRDRVLAGESFVGALRPVVGSRAGEEVDTLTVRWGTAEPEVEETLFNLRAGEVSLPFAADGEFRVAGLLGEEMDAFPTEEDFALKRDALARNLRKRKQRQAFITYYRDMMAGRRTSVPPEQFKYLVESLEAVLLPEGSEVRLRAPTPSPMNQEEYARAQAGLAGSLYETLVTFADGSTWSMLEFLQRLSVGRFPLEGASRSQLRWSLRRALVSMIEQEYVHQAALARGLDRSPEVAAEVRMWHENLAAHAMLQRVLGGTVPGDDEQESYALSETQLRTLADTLMALAQRIPVRCDKSALLQLQVTNAGLLAMKTHFPGRLVVPVPLPLEQFQPWQEFMMGKLGIAGSKHD